MPTQNSQDLISVVIPAYNHEKFIQETIRSVINQTYKNIELIIINDGSLDKTWDKIIELEQECKERFKNVVFSSQENQGTAETLNSLLSHVKGAYVFLTASDDVVEPNAIEFLHSFLSENKDYGLAVGDNEFIDENSKRIYWDENQNPIETYGIYDTFGAFLKKARKEIDFNSARFGTYSSLIWGNYIPNGYLIRKSVLDKIEPFTNEAPLEDYYLMLQLSKYSKMKYFDKVLFKYRCHSSNTSSQMDKMLAMTRKTIFYEYEVLKRIDIKSGITKDAIFTIKHGGKRFKVGIPFFCEFYKNKRITRKQTVLEIFGFKFILRQD